MRVDPRFQPRFPSVPEIDIDAARRWLAQEPRPFILDVREPVEFAQGRIPGATLLPLGELEERVAEVPRDRPILAICHSGQRSLAAAALLLSLGYTEVANVAGGTAAWIERGFPIER